MGSFCYNLGWNIGSVLACILVVAVVIAAAVLLAAFSVLRHVSITVEDASLTKFALATSPATALAYNLSLTLAVRNPNWAMAMKNTKPLEAEYSFDGQQFDRVQVSDKGDRHAAGKTIVYRLVTGSGSDYVSLGNAGVPEYQKQKADGTFEVVVKLTGEVRYTAHYKKCKIEATCPPLKLQLIAPALSPAPAPAGGTPSSIVVVFQKVKCKLAKPEKGC